MSKGIIQDKINQIATETEFEGVTHVEVAELLTLINNDKVDKTEAVAYESGFQGSITPDTLPASGWIPGIYTAEVSGTYNNAGGLAVNLNDGYTALLFDGERWTKIVLPIVVNGIIPDWSDEETDLKFPKTRIFENYLYRVKPGQTATSVDVPGISDKWELINGQLSDNGEFLKVWVDQAGQIIFGIRRDSSLYSPSFDFSHYKFFPDVEEDVENHLEITKDSTGKLIKSVEADGTNYLPILKTDNLKVDGIEFGDPALLQLSNALKSIGFGGGKGDQSDSTFIQLPIPKMIAYLDLDIDFDLLPTAKPTEVESTIQYWDRDGNYFKKPVTISVQGTSSADHLRKNFTLDFDTTIRFENWADRDSYYLKSFYTDAFRGQSIVAYWIFKEVNKTYAWNKRKAFYSDYAAPNYWTGKGNLQTDMISGANYIADGFPVALYCKGAFVGVYCIVQKKHRDNFDMKKGTAKHIWLDGLLSWEFFGGNIKWSEFELRNPAIEKDINGNNYDGDFPTEIPASATKDSIIALSNYVGTIDSQTTTALKRAKFLEFFDLDTIMDYFIVCNYIVSFDSFGKNWQWYTKDGIKWAIGAHDFDNIFGQYWRGDIVIIDDVANKIWGLEGHDPTKYIPSLFLPELKIRYAQLKSLGILTPDNVVEKLKKWLDIVTYPMLKNDLAIWTETPSFRNSKTDSNWVAYHMNDGNLPGVALWDASKNYAVGEKCKVVLQDDTYGFKALKSNVNKNPITGGYANYPHNLGFYNSVDRVRQILIKRSELMDGLYS